MRDSGSEAWQASSIMTASNSLSFLVGSRHTASTNALDPAPLRVDTTTLLFPRILDLSAERPMIFLLFLRLVFLFSGDQHTSSCESLRSWSNSCIPLLAFRSTLISYKKFSISEESSGLSSESRESSEGRLPNRAMPNWPTFPEGPSDPFLIFHAKLST